MATYSNGYDHRRLITIPPESVSGSSDFTNFPFLFRQTDTVYKDTANGGEVHYNSAIDIRYELEDGTKLDHFLERWNNVTGEVIAWIRIPTLKATDTTRIYMYWGKDIGSSEENESGIWNSSTYRGVYHLWQDAGGSAPQFTDVSGNGNHGSATGGMSSSNTVEGKLGRALNLTGANYVTIPDSASLHITGDLTVSYWMKPAGSYPRSRRENPVHKAYSGEWGNTFEVTGKVSYYHGSAGTDGGTYQGFSSDARINDNNWHHVQLVRDTTAAKVYVYIDGSRQGSMDITVGRVSGTNPVYIGNGYVSPFTGAMDEVRIQATARSADWVMTEYNNQNDPDNFFRVEDGTGTFGNGYQYRRLVTVDHTKVSGGANLSRFPMLVSTTLADLKSTANGGKVHQSTATDIRFEAMNGDRLSYEIDKYDATTGELVAWVLVPTLTYSTDYKVYMYYGKNIDTSEENALDVWADYTMVQHFDNTPDATAATFEMLDSGPRHFDGSGYGAMGSGNSVTGKIGKAVSFGGTRNDDQIYVPHDNELNFDASQDFSIDIWIKAATTQVDTANVDNSILEKWGEASAGYPYVIRLRNQTDSTPGLINFIRYNLSSSASPSYAGGFLDNQWHKITAKKSGSTLYLYTDGVQRSTATDITGTITNTQNLHIGARGSSASIPSGSSNNFTGSLDELRIIARAQTAGWITTEYNNQNSPSTFHSIGSEEVPEVAADATSSQTLDSVTLIEHKTLTINEAAHTHTLDTIALTQKHTIVVTDLAHSQTLDNVGVFAQNSLLVVPDLIHGHTLDPLDLIDGGIPVPEDALHGQSLDNVVLTQRHLLSIASMAHSQTLDNVAITQAHQLSGIADLLHAHAIEPVTLTQAHFLALQDVLHAQTVENIALFQRHVLAVQDALHGHLLDNPYVYTMIPIVVQDMQQGQLLDATIIQVWKKDKPTSGVLIGETIPRIMIIDNSPNTKVKPEAASRPRGASISGEKPIIVGMKNKPRVK